MEGKREEIGRRVIIKNTKTTALTNNENALRKFGESAHEEDKGQTNTKKQNNRKVQTQSKKDKKKQTHRKTQENRHNEERSRRTTV